MKRWLTTGMTFQAPLANMHRVRSKMRRMALAGSLKRHRAPAGAARLVRYGTHYGGKFIDVKVARKTILPDSFIVSAGAGEDISFDLEMQRAYGCHIIIADPTPRAVEHYEGLVHSARRGGGVPIRNSSDEFYDLNGVDLAKVHFTPCAVWTEKTALKLWAPVNPAHVSCSVVSRQPSLSASRSATYIEVPAKTISQLLSEHNIDEMPLLKLDVLGAECVILNHLIEEGPLPQQINVRFYEESVAEGKTFKEIKAVFSRLIAANYELLYCDDTLRCLFRRAGV